jgi:DNA polymerase III subunit beta
MASTTLRVPFQGESLEIGFDAKFLRDGLRAFEEGDVLVKLNNPLRPMLIEAADDPSLRYLIMPIRLDV